MFARTALDYYIIEDHTHSWFRVRRVACLFSSTHHQILHTLVSIWLVNLHKLLQLYMHMPQGADYAKPLNVANPGSWTDVR